MALRKNGPGVANVREAVPLINGLAESPRESDVRVALYENGYFSRQRIGPRAGTSLAGWICFTRSGPSSLNTTEGGKLGGLMGVTRTRPSTRSGTGSAASSQRGLSPSGSRTIRLFQGPGSTAWRDCGTRVARFPQDSGAPPCQAGWRGERTRNWCGCPWGDRLPGRGRGSRRGSPRLGGRRNPRG